MPLASFPAAKLIDTYEPGKKHHAKLPISEWEASNISIVNKYCKWLRRVGRKYEVRLHHQGFLLIKSEVIT